eukprot:249411_1
MSLNNYQECLVIYKCCKEWSTQFTPTDIIQHILLWFGSTKEKWDNNNTSNNISIHNTTVGSCVKRMLKWDGYHYNAFGYNLISYGESKTWKLKIIHTKPLYNSCIQFGIIQFLKIENDMKGSFCQMTHFNGYGAYAKNGRLFHGSYYPHANKYKRIPAVTTGDNISITLDLTPEIHNNGELSYIINDCNESIIAFSDIDTMNGEYYVLAVALYAQNDTVCLIE